MLLVAAVKDKDYKEFEWWNSNLKSSRVKFLKITLRNFEPFVGSPKKLALSDSRNPNSCQCVCVVYVQ